MALTSRDRVDLLASGPGNSPVEGQSVTDASEDAMLVGAARDGDRAAFGRLYHRYARMVHGVLLAKVPLGEVDDLVQDVFMIALGAFPGCGKPEALAHGWRPSPATARTTTTGVLYPRINWQRTTLTRTSGAEMPAARRTALPPPFWTWSRACPLPTKRH
jgi:hypothetical protein